MGTFYVPIEIGDPVGRRFETVDALVDTGASLTALPASILRDLGVEPHDRVTFFLADDSAIELEIGRTWVRVDGKAEITLVVFAGEGTEPLLGSHTLQALFLGVDPPNERLIPVPGLLK